MTKNLIILAFLMLLVTACSSSSNRRVDFIRQCIKEDYSMGVDYYEAYEVCSKLYENKRKSHKVLKK